MRLAQACLLVTAPVLALQSPARADPAPDPQARAVETSPGKPRNQPPPVRVVLVRPADADPITAEAIFRIQGELTAEGFSVVLVDASTAAPGRCPERQRERGANDGAGATPADRPSGPGIAVDAEAAQASPVAIRLSLDTSTHVAELVVVRSKELTRCIDTRDAPADHVAEVLAVRAVELVRASLVELALPAARPVPVAPQAAAKLRDPSWGLEAGTSLLVSPRNVGPAALALFRIRFAPLSRLELRLTFAGLGTSPRVEGPDGTSARVTQLLALSEVALRPWPDLRVRPSFSLGAGALDVSAEGDAPAPYRGTGAATWSALLAGGAGAEVLVVPRFGVAAEVRAFAAIPYPSVRFLGDEAARVGMPGVLANVTLVGWL
jgi:hypothetical protein